VDGREGSFVRYLDVDVEDIGIGLCDVTFLIRGLLLYTSSTFSSISVVILIVSGFLGLELQLAFQRYCSSTAA
jgi:hypothetical protein